MNGWREECLRRFKQTQKYNNYDKEDLVEELIEKEQELQRKDNIINVIKEELSDDNKFELFYADENINAVMTLGAKYYREYILDKIKELEESK